jgi:16S rRNA processing protein RimM
VVVGQIVRAHGISGEVAVEIRTDQPAERFAAGSVLGTEPAGGPLTVVSSRWHAGRLLVRFAESADRTRAESLRGVWLSVDASEVASASEEDAFPDHELIGLAVRTTTGEHVGAVTDVLHLGNDLRRGMDLRPGERPRHGQDLLVIEPAAGSGRTGDILVPFVAAIVVDVDLPGRALTIDPPPGLLELATGAAPSARHGRGETRGARGHDGPGTGEAGGGHPGGPAPGRAP